MTRWLLIATAIALFAVAGIAIWHAVHSPAFWTAAIGAVASAVGGALLPVITRRMPPEDEARMREAKRAGLEWDHVRKRPRDR